LFTSSQAPMVKKLLVCRPAGCLRSLCRALNFIARKGKKTITQGIGQPLTYSRKDTQTMDIYTLTIGQAIDYRRYSIGTMRCEWHHGHIVDLDTHPYQPLM